MTVLAHEIMTPSLLCVDELTQSDQRLNDPRPAKTGPHSLRGIEPYAKSTASSEKNVCPRHQRPDPRSQCPPEL